MIVPFDTVISVMTFPDRVVSGLCNGITSSFPAILVSRGATGCIRRLSYREESAIVHIKCGKMTNLHDGSGIRHVLVILDGEIDITSGMYLKLCLVDLVSQSALDFRVFRQLVKAPGRGAGGCLVASQDHRPSQR